MARSRATMDVYEVFTAPESREDAHGQYHYVCIGAWENLTAKQRGDGIKRTIGGAERTAQLFNDFKVRYATTGVQIVTRQGRDETEWQLASGVWVPVSEAVLLPAGTRWNRETVSRDTSAEITDCIERYMLRAAANIYRGDMRGTTLNLQVAAGADDAIEGDGGAGFSSASATHSNNSNTNVNLRFNVGARFTGATIAVGSTINSCIVQFNVPSTVTDDPNVDLLFNDVDDAANFTDEADVTSRARTSASVQWTATGTGTGFQSSPDIKTPLQEVIDRAGWASGNDLCVLSDGRSDSNKSFSTTAYDGSSSNAPKLDIDYTAPSTGQPAVKRMGGVRFAHNLGYGVW